MNREKNNTHYRSIAAFFEGVDDDETESEVVIQAQKTISHHPETDISFQQFHSVLNMDLERQSEIIEQASLEEDEDIGNLLLRIKDNALDVIQAIAEVKESS